MKFVQKMFASGARGYLTKNSERAEMYEAIVRVHAGKCYVSPEISEKGYRISSFSEVNSSGIEYETLKIIRA